MLVSHALVPAGGSSADGQEGDRTRADMVVLPIITKASGPRFNVVPWLVSSVEPVSPGGLVEGSTPSVLEVDGGIAMVAAWGSTTLPILGRGTKHDKTKAHSLVKDGPDKNIQRNVADVKALWWTKFQVNVEMAPGVSSSVRRKTRVQLRWWPVG